jgi:hypothetical protein
MDSGQEDPADILNDALEFLGGSRAVEDEIIKYGDLQLTVAAKVTAAIANGEECFVSD